MKKINRTLHKCCLSGLISLALCAPVPAVYAASIETGYSPEGTALQLVLKTINSAQQEIRLMGVVCGRGRNPTLRLWPAIFSGEIDVFPSERRNMGQEIGR